MLSDVSGTTMVDMGPVKGAVRSAGSMRSRILLSCAVLIVLQWVVFWPALDNKFLAYDDDTYVYNNLIVQSLGAVNILTMFSKTYFHSYTPLALFSHAIDYYLWNANPWGHHFTSIVLHCINSLLVFYLSLLLFRFASRDDPVDGSRAEIVGAFVSAVLFSIHPLRVESVVWISDRKDLLLGLFSLLCVIAYLKYATKRLLRHGAPWYSLCLVCFVLALLSKSTAVVLPAVLLLLDALTSPKDNWRTLISEKIPFILLTLVFGFVSVVAAQGGTASDVVFRFSGFEKVLMPFYTLLFYPVKILWPNNLTPIYDSPDIGWMLAGLATSVAITIAFAVHAKRGHKYMLVAWLCFVVCILPTITGLSSGIQPWADRYSYLSTTSFFLLAGAGLQVLLSKPNLLTRSLISIVVLVVVFTLCFVSRQQTGIWKDSETLFRYAVEKAPASAMAHGNLGQALLEENSLDAAIESLRRAITLEPHYPVALYNAGIAFERKQNSDSAVAYYGRAIALDSMCENAYVNLANLFVNRDRVDDAIPLYERAIKLTPSDPDAHYNFGNALYARGDRQRALESYQVTVKLAPGYASAYHNMGVILLNMGNADAALTNFRFAARLGSSDAQQLLRSKGYSW